MYPTEILPSNLRSEMEQKILSKLDELEKYIPFVDYLLALWSVDQEEHKKFTKIKKWIQSKERYSLDTLAKIEKSIVTQYNNLMLLNDIKVPKEIMAIFSNVRASVKFYTVDLCSDDEENNIKLDAIVNSSTKKNIVIDIGDDDDEVCIVNETTNDRPFLHNDEASTSSTEMWQRIDRICYAAQQIEEVDHKLFDIQTIKDLNISTEEEKLFTRRESVEKKKHKKKKHKKDKNHDKVAKKSGDKEKRKRLKGETALTVPTIIETITLESSSEEEGATVNKINEIKEKEKKTQKETMSNVQQEPADREPAGQRPADREPADHEQADHEPAGQEPADHEPTGQEPAGQDPVSSSIATLENMDIDELSRVLKNLSKRNGIDLEDYLQELLTKVKPTSHSETESVNMDKDELQTNGMPTQKNNNEATEYFNCDATNPTHLITDLNKNHIAKTQYVGNSVHNLNENNCNSQYDNSQQRNPLNYSYMPSAMQNIMPPTCEPQMPIQETATRVNVPNYRYKINYSDPRIMRQLKVIQSSANYSAIARETAANLTNYIPQMPSTTYTPSSYGEYKRQREKQRLQAEMQKKLELEQAAALEKFKAAEEARKVEEAKRLAAQAAEQQRKAAEEEREKQAAAQAAECEQRELKKHTEQIREILSMHTKDLGVLLKQNADKSRPPTRAQEQPTVSNNCQPITKRSNDEATKQFDRIFKTLECTVKGFNSMPQFNGGRRRASISARCAIAEQANCRTEEENSQELEQEQTLYTDANSNFLDNSISPCTTPLASTDKVYDQTVLSDPKLHMQPVVKLKKLNIKYTQDVRDIRELKEELSATIVKPILENKRRLSFKALLVEDTSRTDKSIVEQIASPRPVIKRTNTDALMTERNTRFCVLCKSKPANLTNHYVCKHKTESYVSRLSSMELNTLQVNHAFATLVPSNSRNLKYKINCAFCADELKDTFNNLHRHFSTHTGEYAFQCSACKMQKPFRADIESHQLHSKSCRNHRTLTLYQYPSNLMVIYLHCCKLCNFVQLNKANVFKHQRDHHNAQRDDPKSVEKYMLAAIKDDKEASPSSPEPAPESAPEPAPSPAPSPAPRSTFAATMIKAAEKPAKPLNEFSLNNIATSIAADDGVRVSNEPIDDQEVEELMSSLFGYSASQDIQEFIPEPITKTTAAVSTNQPENFSNSQTFSAIPCSRPNDKSPITTAIIHGSDMNDITPTPKRLSTTQRLTNSSIVHMPMFLPNEDIKPDLEELAAQIMAQQQLNDKIANDSLATENFISTPTRITIATVAPTTTSKQPLQKSQSLPHENYRSYAAGSAAFGLLKCMASDCTYSTDVDIEMLEHLDDHNTSECPPQGFLDCAYCQPNADSILNTPTELIAHIRKRHNRNRYQCGYCSYRSCVAGNVLIHCRQSHCNVKPNDIVYECKGPETTIAERLPQMMRSKAQNVQKFNCSHCTEGFFVSEKLLCHYQQAHNIEINQNDMQAFPQYSCIYCAYDAQKENDIVAHLAKQHPDEYAFVCERILQTGLETDALQNLIFRNVEVIVSQAHIMAAQSMEANTFVANNNDVDAIMDTQEFEKKPNVEELVDINIEVLRPLLDKLTRKTGVAPSLLYRCPEDNCGGFFSLYELWTRHMTQRHQTLLTICPHCPIELPLTEFREHFIQHCQHLYICFHCTETFVAEHQLLEHANTSHRDLQQMRLETIPFNINNSFKLLISKTLHVERLKFLVELQTILKQRVKILADFEAKSMLTEWRVPANADWLENYPERSKSCIACNCRLPSDEKMFEHILASHSVNGLVFSCRKCNFKDKFNSWEPIFTHIKSHEVHTYICCICSHYEYDRRKMSKHVCNTHDLRDVPLLNIKRRDGNVYAEFSIIFATNKRTFANEQQCLFCSKHVDAMVMHLKQEHGIHLRYFCELCNMHLPSLEECRTHFHTTHNSKTIKLYCMLTCKENLYITSIQPLSLSIENAYTEKTNLKRSSFHMSNTNVMPNKIPKINIKQEPSDDSNDSECLIFMEPDDIVVEEELKACRSEKQQQQQQNTNTLEVPRIKCIGIKNLVQSNNAQTESNAVASAMAFTSPTRERQALLLEGYQDAMSTSSSPSSDVRVKPITITLLTKSAEGSTTARAPTLSVRITSSPQSQQQQPLQGTSVLPPVLPQQSQQQRACLPPNPQQQQQQRVFMQTTPQQQQTSLPQKVAPQRFETHSTLKQYLNQPPLQPQIAHGVHIPVIQNRTIQTVSASQQSFAIHQFQQHNNYITAQLPANLHNLITLTEQRPTPLPTNQQHYLQQSSHNL